RSARRAVGGARADPRCQRGRPLRPAGAGAVRIGRMNDSGEGNFFDQIVNVERADADLYVERVGPDQAPVVYYLHGGPGYGSHSFRDLMGDDLEQFQVIYADQRGGGRSYGSGAADL